MGFILEHLFFILKILGRGFFFAIVAEFRFLVVH